VQGKAALKRLGDEVSSPYFPEMVDAAVQHFRQGALLRPRESLVRNFSVVLIKTILKNELDGAQERRNLAAIAAVRKMHPSMAHDVWTGKLSEICRHLEHAHLDRVVRLLKAFPEVWEDLGEDVQGVLNRYVEAMPDDHLTKALVPALDIAPLRASTSLRLTGLTDTQVSELLTLPPHPEVVEYAVALYISSSNFALANQRARNMLPALCAYLKPEQVERIIKAGRENEQLLGSTSLHGLFHALRHSERVSVEQFDTLLRQHGFDELADAWSGNTQKQDALEEPGAVVEGTL
jgi:hypothetical protein